MEGTPIYFIPIFKTLFKEHCYTDSEWQPFPFILSGVAGDCCYAEINETLSSTSFKNLIREAVVNDSMGSYTDGAYCGEFKPFEGKSYNEYQEACNSRMLFLSRNVRKEVQFSYIRKDIVDDLFNSLVISKYDPKISGYSEFTFSELLLKITNDAEVYRQALIKELTFPHTTPSFEFDTFIFENRFKFRSFIFTGCPKPSIRHNVYSVFSEYIHSPYKFHELYTDYAKLCFIDDIMYKFKRVWMLNTFCGNQDQDFEDYNYLTIAIKNAIGRELTRFDEYD